MTKTNRLRLCIALTAGCLSLALVNTAHGQPAAAPGPALSPPKLVTFVDAPYPEAAKAAGRAAAVELELHLNAAGQVTDVRVVTPAGDGVGVGFDEAAVAAARKFVFEPARRDGQPIPARIRYRYAFEPPAPPPPTTGLLEGRVLLRGGDDLVRGAAVTLSSADGSVSRSGTTGADGSFAFADLPPGRYRVRVAGQDLAPLEGQEDVTTGDATSVTYRLDATQAAPSGKVLEFGATATIEAPPREVTKRTLKTEELLRAAGTRGDALKAVEYMPGVARGTQGMVLIRGSGPSDSVVQFEGVPVYRLYHFGDLTSFVASRLLDRIDLYPGNFSTRYGRKLGGVIDVGVRDPASDGLHAVADLNFIDTSLLVETPLGRRGAIAVSAKRSYLDLWLGKVMPEQVGVIAAPVYWDYQLIATYAPSDADKLRAMIYGSYDDIKLLVKDPLAGDPAVRGEIGNRSGFHRGQLSWKHRYGEVVEQDMSVTAGTFAYKASLGPEVSFDVPGVEGFARAEWRANLHEGVRLMGGFDVQAVRFSGSYTGPAQEQLDGNPDAAGSLADKRKVSLDLTYGYVSPAAYLELLVQPFQALRLVPGLRVDRYGNIGRWSVDPRITARLELGSSTVLKGGVGLFTQEPDLGEALPTLGNPHLRAARAQHYGLGIEQTVGERLMLTADGFYKRMDRMVVGSQTPGEVFANDGVGRVQGLELSARLQPNRRTTGFLSYTLSRSERQDHAGEAWRLLSWDQTHILTVSGALRLGRGWDLSATGRYVTGNPTTPAVSSTYSANSDLYRPVWGAVNSERNDAFARLDLRVEKTWKLKGASVAAYLDVQNVNNRKNGDGRTYNYNFTKWEPTTGFPPFVFPTLGVRGEI